jgi:serine/threonine protein kinase
MTMGGTHPALQNFQILQELSHERGNKVYLARSKSGSVVAITVLASGAISEDASSALAKEASHGARLGHDAILQTKSMILEKDFAAVVTEFVPGISLQRLLRFATGRGVRLPDICGWYILERVLAALASAHAPKDASGASQPILHRGVSPASVIVGWDGTVKIGGFGLVRMRQLVSSGAPASADRELPAIMAPEETRGDKPDARGDVYCAALLALRLATGRTPYARFRKARSEMILAMSEGNVARLGQTRTDMPTVLRDTLDSALEPDREKRKVTADDLLTALRASVDTSQGKAALAKLLGRWREALETQVTPWERRASIPDDVPDEETGLLKPGALALSTPDERPSDSHVLGASDVSSEPWRKDKIPAEETALAPTDPAASLSRLGSIAPDALIMPLPAMRITMPELPTYGGPPVNIPVAKPKQGIFSGGVAAAVIATMFIVLLGGAYMLFRWLLASPG